MAAAIAWLGPWDAAGLLMGGEIDSVSISLGKRWRYVCVCARVRDVCPSIHYEMDEFGRVGDEVG